MKVKKKSKRVDLVAKGYLVPVLFLFLLSSNLEGTNSWQVFSIGQGLPGKNVLALAVCSNSLAVGTENGLAVYHGEKCQWSVPVLPEAVASIAIKDLAYDKFKNLWMATPNGVVVLQEKSVEWFKTADGLPALDSERLQVKGEEIFVGTFGGFVSRAFTPRSGRTSFTAVNYKPRSKDEENLRLQSIGISGLAMKNSSEGWFSTKGGGLILTQGLSQLALDRNAGLAGDWVEAFWLFEGQQKTEHIIAATSNGLSLIRNLAPVAFVQIPAKSESTWISSLVAIRSDDGEEEPRKGENKSWDLPAFLGNRTLWVGTRAEGLFRFERGKWTNYIPENSGLPSRNINRIYFHQGRLLVCTTEGLVVIPLAANAFDEFKILGFGRKNFKTIFPSYDSCGVTCMDKKTDFWVGTEMGLSRFIPPPGVSSPVLDDGPNLSSSHEDQQAASPQLGGGDGEARWERFSVKRRNIISDNISSLVCDPNGFAWMIFNNKFLTRVKVVPIPKKWKEIQSRKEKYLWNVLNQDQVPWRIGLPLNVVWYKDGKLYIGTNGDGFFILKNPSGVTESGEKKYIWQHVNQLQGLYEENVIGFASQVVADEEPRLVLLHPNAATIWDRLAFYSVPFGARREYTCVAGDAQGNVWFGSDGGGVFRLKPDMKIVNYSGANAYFESNTITAIFCPADSTPAGGVSVWVACDSQHGNLDQLPSFKGDGTIEGDIDGASMHYYDGLTWDKWKVPGVRCLLGDADYLWVGTNIRLRRFYIPVFMDK